jgi:antitoxin CcdA
MRIFDAHDEWCYISNMDSKSHHHEPSKRRPVNLTIRADVLEEAKALKLNTSQAAETGIIGAVKKAYEQQWLKDSQSAIQAYNERIDKAGPLLTPNWLRD